MPKKKKSVNKQQNLTRKTNIRQYFRSYVFIHAYMHTVLCKSNESEFRRISFIVLANFRLHVGEISRGISHRSMRYFEENAAKLCEFFRNFEVTNFPCFRNFEEMNFRFFEFSKRQTVIKNTLYIVNCSNIHNLELNALYLFTPRLNSF